MNKIVKGCLATVMALGVMSAANAEFVAGNTYSNEYGNLGEFVGIFNIESGENTNDLIAMKERIVSSNLFTEDELNLTWYSKAEKENDFETNYLTVTFGIDNKAGKWETKDNIHFYAVKAGGEVSIWYMGVNGAKSGAWTTSDMEVAKNNGKINQPDISHLAAYQNTASVPEPTTTALLGISLLVLGFLPKRKKR